MSKTPKTSNKKAAETQARKRFFYVRTKTAKVGFMTGKANSADEALKTIGLEKDAVVESRELSTNRHDSVVAFCDILDSIGDAAEPKSQKPVDAKKKVETAETAETAA